MNRSMEPRTTKLKNFESDNQNHGKSVSQNASFLMAAALAAHFFGYECARAASIALLTSKEKGLGTEALIYTVAIGSPAGALVLYFYARSIRLFGPHSTLRVSALSCLCLKLCMILFCGRLVGVWSQGVIVIYYCFREIYVSLLSTQYWSFIASVLDKKKSGFVVSFAGAVSVSSALGGCAVEHLVNNFGVHGLLVSSFIASLLSTILAESAYYFASIKGHAALFKQISTTHDVDHKNQHTHNCANQHAPGHAMAHTNAQGQNSANIYSKPNLSVNTRKVNIWIEFWHIMYRSPTLRLLYLEAIFHQLVANLLNVMFHDALRLDLPNNSSRAVLVGRFFATVNVTSCALQLFVLPSVLSTSTLPQVLGLIPTIILGVTALGWLKPSLNAVMFSFGTLKVLEYSIMTAASEMIYMPMSVDDRYLGKEVIRFFGHKLGKSGSSVLLSSAASVIQPSMTTMYSWTGAATLLWGAATYTLAAHLLQREAASASHSSQEHGGDGIGAPSGATAEDVTVAARGREEASTAVEKSDGHMPRVESSDESQSSSTTSESAEATGSGLSRSRSSSELLSWTPVDGQGEGGPQQDAYTESEDCTPSPPQQWWAPSTLGEGEAASRADDAHGKSIEFAGAAGLRRRTGRRETALGAGHFVSSDVAAGYSASSSRRGTGLPPERTHHRRRLPRPSSPPHPTESPSVTEEGDDASAGFILRIGSVLTSLSALVDQYPSLSKSTSTPAIADEGADCHLSTKSSGGFLMGMEGIPEE